MQSKHTESPSVGGDSFFSWLFRLVKGIVIGTGFIIPGVSGGVFAAIFGVYEPMIRFFANIRKNFMKNVFFFLPIGIGVLVSMVICSKLLGTAFERFEVPLLWFFIGCVLGTLPMLYQQAGKEGRQSHHMAILIITVIAMSLFLSFIKGWLSGVTIPTESIWVWLMAGALMGLGAIVPGLSPSNFLLYMGIYGTMMNRIGGMDLGVLVPVVVGALLCFLLLSKAFDRLFAKAYGGIYHFIIGLVIASTIMIIPWPGKVLETGAVAAYTSSTVLISIAACLAGIALGYYMGVLETKYKPEV